MSPETQQLLTWLALTISPVIIGSITVPFMVRKYFLEVQKLKLEVKKLKGEVVDEDIKIKKSDFSLKDKLFFGFTALFILIVPITVIIYALRALITDVSPLTRLDIFIISLFTCLLVLFSLFDLIVFCTILSVIFVNLTMKKDLGISFFDFLKRHI